MAQRTVGDLEASVFELLTRLLDDGWDCMVVPTGSRAKAISSGIQVLVDYTVGGPKVFWMKVKQKKHGLWYLRALRLAAEHGKMVPHLCNEGFYEELVTGKIKMERAPRFEFHDEVEDEETLTVD